MRFTTQQNSLQGKRHDNQDRMGYIYSQDALLMVVCDGLGGHEHGEIAATWVLETLAHRFQHFAKPIIADPIVFLEASIIAAHGLIINRSMRDSLKSSPRTTVVVALIQNGQVWIAHAGDSRAYLIRDDMLHLRTHDHSKLQYLVDTGRIDPGSITHNHPDRNKLINCVGAEIPPRVEHTGPVKLVANDLMMLCTDGVWGAMEELQLLRIIGRGDIARDLPDLVATAHAMGGDYADDATAIVIRWLENEQTQDTEVFQSTIQITLASNTDLMAMTDDEIDAQIREIHEAIKSNPKSTNKYPPT